jgi:hypothetical protein
MFLQAFNFYLQIIALPPGLELRVNSTKAGELRRGGFTAFRMNIEHLSMLCTMKNEKTKKKDQGTLTLSDFLTHLAVLALETCPHDPL